MLLKALKEQAERTKELPDFHSVQEVRYAIDLDKDGQPTGSGLRELSDPVKPNRGVRLTIPSSSRTSGISPLPLDRGDYVLGIPPPTKNETDAAKKTVRTKLAHAAYVALLDEAAEQTGHIPINAALRFARDIEPESLKLPAGFDASRFVAIFVEGKLLAQDPVVEAWWISRCKTLSESPLDRICGVCGSPCSPLENIPIQVRGLTRIGGQATMALVSGNNDVFERHGMPRAAGASICLECGNSTHQMLNQLIASDKNSFSYGSGMFIWWSVSEVDEVVGALCTGGSDMDVRDAIGSLLAGNRPNVDLDASFVDVALGANSSRVIVRSWIHMTIHDALKNIDRWFSRITIVGRDGLTYRYPNVFKLMASIAPPGQGGPLSRLRPDIVDLVMQAALNNQPLPPMILTQAVGRLRATGGEITSSIAALIKACITSINSPDPEVYMTSLDETSTDEAYLCGRLLALLDNAARLATSANNSLVDRSYSATSTMPQMNLTRLLRLHRAHLEKLKRDKPGAAVRIDRSIISVMDGLTRLPKTLPVEGQARFALGLYHQQAADRAAIQKAKEAKALGEIAVDVADDEEGTN